MRITILQRPVQKNNDLRQIHVLDSVWRSKSGSTAKFSFEVYYDLLCNASYQHDLDNAAGQKQRQTFISQQVDLFDESDHDHGEDIPLDQDEDDSSLYSIFNLLSTALNVNNLPRFLSLTNFGKSFWRLQSSLSLSTTRRLNWLTPNHTPMVATLNLLWVKQLHSPSKSTFLRTILLKTLLLKILLKLWYVSA